jgi:hypothetical protein
MRLNLRILPGKSFNLFLRQTAAEPDVEFAREVVVEFGEELDVEE